MTLSAHNIQQLIKWTVYTLLLVNFGFYLLDDLRIAQHILRDGWTILDRWLCSDRNECRCVA